MSFAALILNQLVNESVLTSRKRRYIQVALQQYLDKDKFLDEQDKASDFIPNKMLPKASN